MEKSHLEKSEVTNEQISSNTKCNSKQIVEKANERPEWLPDGWRVDFRTRKSGALQGSGYKCYIDPLNGYKFYSKPEVLRFLETTKDNSCTSKKEKKFTTTHSPSNVVAEKSTVEDLPPGWIKEVKINKNGNGIRKDQFYADPVSGYVFQSKKDVVHYLESGDINTCVFRPTRRQNQDEDKFIPSPAAKRQKLKQSATQRQHFSGKEISDKNNLELSDANSSKEGQDVKVSSGMMVAPVPTSESVVKMHLSEDAALNPPQMKNTSDPGSSEKMFSAEGGVHLTVADVVPEKVHVVDMMENTNEKNCSNPSISKNKKELNVPRRFSRRLAGVEPDQFANNVINGQTLKVPQRNLRKSRTTVDADMADELSQHFNVVPEIEVLNKSNKLSDDPAVFIEQSHLLETEKVEDNKPEQNQCSLIGDPGLSSLKPGLASETHVMNENKLHASEIGKSGSQDILSGSNESSNKKEHHIPCRASEPYAGFEHDLISNSISCEKAPKYRSKNSEGEVNTKLQQSEGGTATDFADHAPINGESANERKSPKISPLPNNQQEKLEQEQMDYAKSEPQLSFEFHYSWSDPSLEFAINTLTGALPVEDSVDNQTTMVSETDIQQKDLLDNVTGSIRNQNTQVHSNKSKNKKELKIPRRSSKRLAGLDPEVLPAERALEYATRKSCKDKPTANAILTNGASEHLAAGEETKLTLHASESLETTAHGESSNICEKSYDAQTVPKEQSQELEAEHIGDERSEPQLPLLFGDSWSDPCLEFAIKTLTGALPDDDAAEIFPVMTSDVNDQPNKELLEKVAEKSINEEAHDNSNQSQDEKELNVVCQPLAQPELRTSSTSCENDPKFSIRDSYSDEGNITRNLDGESLHIEAGNVAQLAHHSSNINPLIHEERLKENGQVLEGESVATEQPQLDTEMINPDSSESLFCASFMDSWSDPCLEFAFKTLTGALPVEEDFALQECFQEPANFHDQRDVDSTLPDFGSSSFSQSDFSFHYDMGDTSMPGPQLSMNSSILPLEKASPLGCSGVDPQKQYSQSNKNFQGR